MKARRQRREEKGEHSKEQWRPGERSPEEVRRKEGTGEVNCNGEQWGEKAWPKLLRAAAGGRGLWAGPHLHR